MEKVQAILYKIFGASWFTSLLGYIIISAGIAQLILDSLKENGVPTNPQDWLTLIVGIAVRASKQANVSNAEKPMAVAQVVVPVHGQSQAERPTPVVVE